MISPGKVVCAKANLAVLLQTVPAEEEMCDAEEEKCRVSVLLALISKMMDVLAV